MIRSQKNYVWRKLQVAIYQRFEMAVGYSSQWHQSYISDVYRPIELNLDVSGVWAQQKRIEGLVHTNLGWRTCFQDKL